MNESCHTHVSSENMCAMTTCIGPMSNVTRMNESCHTYNHVVSCHTYERVMSHTKIDDIVYMDESCHTYERIMSHTCEQ